MSTTTTERPRTKGLVIANQMFTAVAWYALGDEAKIAALACLAPIEIRAQASVIAADRRCSTSEVISVWVALRYLPRDRGIAARQRQEGQG